MPFRLKRWRLPALLALTAASGLVGCRHRLHPAACFPPPPPLACPPACEVALVDLSAENAFALPGRELPWTEAAEPIDLPTALRLANARNPDIALARERINEALARQDLARYLWLPNLEFSPTWMSHGGLIQRAAGDVIDAPRSSLSLTGGPALSLPLGDALFSPLAARQVAVARQAAAADVTNDRLLDVAVAYIDLLQVYAELQINDESYRNARTLLSLTESYEKAGKGAAADTARARVEVERRERQRQQLLGRLGVASARLGQLVYLPPQCQLRPADPAVVPISIVSEAVPLADLLSQALSNHPELAEGRAEIEAAVQNWRRAKVAPLVPSLRLSYAAGGFGGGPDGAFNAFGGREDFAAAAVWQLQSLGLGNRAAVRERRSQHAQASFRQASVEARVAADVVSAFSAAYARRRELAAAQREVAAARESYRLNEERIRRAPELARPIELLQAIQALAQARVDYLQAVTDYNRAQFRLYTALGYATACAVEGGAVVPTTEPTVPAPAGPGDRPAVNPGQPGGSKPE